MKTIENSRWYLEGVKAEKEGFAITTNPYADGSPKWYIWNAGWVASAP